MASFAMAVPPAFSVPTNAAGAFVRPASGFRSRIGSPEYPAAADRYALYVSYACPWASRCIAAMALKGLEHVIQVIPVAAVFVPTRPEEDGHQGWAFRSRADPRDTEVTLAGVPDVDPIFGAGTIRDVYAAAAPEATVARYSVPILVDKATRTIVCNESSLILRDLGGPLFNEWARFPSVDLYPASLAAAIDAANDAMYSTINDGVYQCGFAKSQGAYDAAAKTMLTQLNAFADLLSTQRYLAGSQLTEADIRLFVTLVRYDSVYAVHFKTNFFSIRYSRGGVLLNYIRDIYQSVGGPGGAPVSSTVRMPVIKTHYYVSHAHINPFSIIAAGPPEEGVELAEPHNRAALP